MPPSVFWYPDEPKRWALIKAVADSAGWATATRPEDADWRVFYRPSTHIELPPDDPYAEASLTWINGRCRDISKRRVHAIFAETFGYPLGLDPATHTGPMLLKSDANYVKDIRIETGPISDLPPDQIAERLIDTRTKQGETREFRVGIVGGRVIYTHVHFREDWISGGVFVNTNTTHRLRPPRAILSAAEISRIEAFCRAFGLDFGGLDVLRDRHDGRIYIIDANNTPSVPSRAPRQMASRCVLAHREAMLRIWPPRSETGAS